MSSEISNADWVRHSQYVACIEESFIPGFHEFVFVLPNLRGKAIRVAPKSDPRAVDLTAMATSILQETKLFKLQKALKDAEVIAEGDVLGIHHGSPWWEPILQRNRQVRAEEEAATVTRHFGDVTHINAATGRHLAELINKELIDVISFQSHTGVSDNNGIRPSRRDILKQRRTREVEAYLDFLVQQKSLRGGVQEAIDPKPTALDEPESAPATEPEDAGGLVVTSGSSIGTPRNEPTRGAADSLGVAAAPPSAGSEHHLPSTDTAPDMVLAAPTQGTTSQGVSVAWTYRTYTSIDRYLQYEGIWFASGLLGCDVWRHDRNLHRCSAADCQKIVSDMSPSTLVCLTCGPKSIIRYCSVQCKVRNLRHHGQFCGNPQNLIPAIIDNATEPPRFSRIAPGIRDRKGLHTFHGYRQKTLAQTVSGRYTIFDPESQEPVILIWEALLGKDSHKEVPFPGYAAEREARVERCLNIALFDHTQSIIIEHLFRLLQHCLRRKRISRISDLFQILSQQFLQEFCFDVRGSWRIMSDEAFCECEWYGGSIAAHEPACQRREERHGEVFRGSRCLKDLVEEMEAKHWILRAWQQQHPTESRWVARVMGSGFPGCIVPTGWAPSLGKGWLGISAPDDDICL
ncbi:MAG: hypothetical protein Q9201_005476 [Fulgogasparrea decipioides]